MIPVNYQSDLLYRIEQQGKLRPSGFEPINCCNRVSRHEDRRKYNARSVKTKEETIGGKNLIPVNFESDIFHALPG